MKVRAEYSTASKPFHRTACNLLNQSVLELPFAFQYDIMLYYFVMETDSFEQLVAEALDSLPELFLELMDNVQVVVEEWPSPEQLAAVGLRSRTQLLGLYEGIPLTRRGSRYGLVAPDKITIFQRPIERICANDEHMRQQVQDTVIHELGHHFGINEERMAVLEAERNRKRRQQRLVNRQE